MQIEHDESHHLRMIAEQIGDEGGEKPGQRVDPKLKQQGEAHAEQQGGLGSGRIPGAAVLRDEGSQHGGERHHHDEQQGLDPGCRAVGGDHLGSQPGENDHQHGVGQWVEHVGKRCGHRHMEQGAPVGQQLRARGEAPAQQALAVAQYIEADQHGHQPGEGSGDGGSPNAPLGEGARPEDEQRIQHAVDQTGDPHHQTGGLGIPRRPDGRIADHGHDQHGDGQIPDEHVVVDEGDELGAGPQQGEQRGNGQCPQPGEQTHQDDGKEQTVCGDAGCLVMATLPQGMTEQGAQARPQPHGQGGDDKGDREGETDGGQRLGTQHADKEGIDQVEGQDGDDAQDHGARHAQQHGCHGGGQHGVGSAQGRVSRCFGPECWPFPSAFLIGDG